MISKMIWVHTISSIYATVMSSIQTRILLQGVKKRTYTLGAMLGLGTVIVATIQIISSKKS
jgi:hypothetical protein